MKKTLFFGVLLCTLGLMTACKSGDKSNDTEKQETKSLIDDETTKADTIPEGYLDMNLPSGTIWKVENETSPIFINFNDAVKQYGDKLPTAEQWEELLNVCTWTWDGMGGYNVVGPNGNFLYFGSAGYSTWDGIDKEWAEAGYYWTSTPEGADKAIYLHFDEKSYKLDKRAIKDRLIVRCVL